MHILMNVKRRKKLQKKVNRLSGLVFLGHPLCGKKGTTKHYLNYCSIMLITGPYTWRQNNLVNYIVTSVDKKFKVYSDLPDWEAIGCGTIPPVLCVTN